MSSKSWLLVALALATSPSSACVQHAPTSEASATTGAIASAAQASSSAATTGAGGSSSSSAASTGGAGGGGGKGPLFFDDFTRNDDVALGNGWQEKTPDAFSLSAGRAKAAQSTLWHDQLCYQLTAVSDLVVSAEIAFKPVAGAIPILFTRAQQKTIKTNKTVDAYTLTLWANETTHELWIGRHRGAAMGFGLPAILKKATVEPYAANAAYRASLAVEGTDPVKLSALLEKRVFGQWVKQVQLDVSDAAAENIGTAGSFGFAGGASDTFDNFRVDAIP